LQAHQLTVEVVGALAVADLRELASVVEATQEIGRLQGDAEYRTLDTLHDRDRVVVCADVVVAADDAPAHEQPRDDNEHDQSGYDGHSAPGLRFGGCLRLYDNAFGCVGPTIDGGGPTGRGIGRGGVIVVAGYGPGQYRLGLAAVVAVDNIGDDDRDVVGTAAPER